MASIQWANPPAHAVAGGEKRTKWGVVTGMLMASPDSWAVVARKPNRGAAVMLANIIAAGKRSEFEPAGSFESKYAENGDGRFDVYARFVGTPSDDVEDVDDVVVDEDDEDDGVGPF